MISDFIASATGAYTLSFAFAFSVGVGLAYSGTPVIRWFPMSAVWMSILVFTVVAVGNATRAPWMGVVFVWTSIITAMLVSGHLLREHPLLRDEPYWRRIVLSVTQPRRLRLSQDVSQSFGAQNLER